MPVINLEDYRPSKKGEPCKVTFFSPTFSADGRIEWTVTIENGDYVGVIEAVKNYGGAYLPSQDGGKTFWFLPWPCAAVRVSTVERST